MNKMSPMMERYLETKKEYPDCILFYRLGDFYEMFFDDAKLVSKELELTLTGKNCGQEERAPMCGVPFHAVDGYLNRLVSKGYKVAICEQTEDPKLAKGLVKRDVVRIVTPGTNLDSQALDEDKNNYLVSVIAFGASFGISAADVTTGDFLVTEVSSLSKVQDELEKFSPKEILCNEEAVKAGFPVEDLEFRLSISVTVVDSWYYEESLCRRKLMDQFHLQSLAGLGLEEHPCGILAAGTILQYLMETQKMALAHLLTIRPYATSAYMILDAATRRNLELTETLREKEKKGSLLWVLDKTKTAMGARKLRSFLEQPLLHPEEIKKRLDAVEELANDLVMREELREDLSPIYDLERLMGKISLHTASPRDFLALSQSLSMIPALRETLKASQGEALSQIYENLDPLLDVTAFISSAIVDDPPLQIREGGFIKEGYQEEVDTLRKAKTEGKSWLAALEEREKTQSGIKNLRIGYNKVFGYYLEVTNSFKNMVPETWMRKQTLANAERYITPELKELEDKILGAEDKLINLEYKLFQELRDKVGAEVGRILETAKAAALLDAYCSLGAVANLQHYVRPVVDDSGELEIKEGRHPVVEQVLPASTFVANDTKLDQGENLVSIITGPNMAGKSTYMRQTALIVLMAQIGSFVPASYAHIGVVDRIFTRVGASDDLASGQSTFMVEMTEVSNILRNATKNSLLILDEIGRGTSTYDGLSIAWAVVEHIANPSLLGAKALFATHYHELTELEGKLTGVKNYCILVKEQGNTIQFLRKITRGGANKSYGIQVARLAGVPDSVLRRASEIARQLEEHDIAGGADKIQISPPKEDQLSLFDPPYEAQASYLAESHWKDTLLSEIADYPLEETTPLEALVQLTKWQKEVKEQH